MLRSNEGIALLGCVRRLIIVGSGSESTGSQTSISTPVHNFVQLIVSACSVELEPLLRYSLKPIRCIGNHKHMTRAVGFLLVVAVPAFFFHQTLDKMPVSLVLGTVRPLQRRLCYFKAKITLSLWMLFKYVAEDVVGSLVLPYAGVFAKFQKIQPWRK